MRKCTWLAAIAGIAVFGCTFLFAQSENLAPTPPMGWSTWNYFHHNITDATLRAQADAMVSSGMRDAGYVYVNIDGGWEGYRDANGVLHPTKDFPDMKALADYIHSKGLKFGIYSGPGPGTCAGAVASYQHEEQDAKMFASWGVDLVKYDLCSYQEIMAKESGAAPDLEVKPHSTIHYGQLMSQQPPAVVEKANDLMKGAYEKMHQAILATGRPMLYSLCQYGYDKVWEWGPQVGGQMWRTSGDVSATYASVTENGFREAGLARYAGPGHWNDPDILEVGVGKMNADESRTNFSLWAILAAPLLAGNDLTHMTPEVKSILLNKDVIAVDQDRLGKQGDRVRDDGPLQVWTKPLSGGDMAVALFNGLNSPTQMSFTLQEVGWHGAANARDLWAHRNLGVLSQTYSAMVPAHGVVMLRLSHNKP